MHSVFPEDLFSFFLYFFPHQKQDEGACSRDVNILDPSFDSFEQRVDHLYLRKTKPSNDTNMEVPTWQMRLQRPTAQWQSNKWGKKKKCWKTRTRMLNKASRKCTHFDRERITRESESGWLPSKFASAARLKSNAGFQPESFVFTGNKNDALKSLFLRR